MTSLAVTPFDDKTTRAVRRRFWLTTAALGRPESNKTQVIIMLRKTWRRKINNTLYQVPVVDFFTFLWYRHGFFSYLWCCPWHSFISWCYWCETNLFWQLVPRFNYLFTFLGRYSSFVRASTLPRPDKGVSHTPQSDIFKRKVEATGEACQTYQR